MAVCGKGATRNGKNSSYELREPVASYKGVFNPENGVLRLENTYFLDEI